MRHWVLIFVSLTTIECANISFVGLQLLCPSTCIKQIACSRNKPFCGHRSLHVRTYSAGGGSVHDLAVVESSLPKKTLLNERQMTVMAGQNLYIVLQSVIETRDDVTSSGAPRLFVKGHRSSVSEIKLSIKGKTEVPPMEAITATGSQTLLLGVTLGGELLRIQTSTGAVSVVSQAMWSAGRILMQGLISYDTATDTLYAILQTPSTYNPPGVCGSTHGVASCLVDIFSFAVRSPSLNDTSTAVGRNVTSFQYCARGQNNRLGCDGTNIQQMWFHNDSLVAIARNPKTGVSFSKIGFAAPQAEITTLYSDISYTYEFISAYGYDAGVTLPNPSAFDGNDMLYAHLRYGSRVALLGVSISKARLALRVPLPKESYEGEPLSSLHVVSDLQ